MESAGLVVGISGLAVAFNDAVDCFNYIQIGRNFGTRSQNIVLKLSNAQTACHAGEHQSPEIRRKAESLLGQIFTLFAEAEKLPTRINRNSDTDSSGYDGSSDSDCTATTLSDQMRSPSLKRQDKTSLSRKTKWALYEEKQLKAVTKDVTELVKDLEELFPAPESLRRQLCEKNVPELSIPRTAPLLKDMAVATDDKMMEEVLKKFKRSQQVHNNTANFGPNNLCTRFGQISGTSGGTFNIGT